MRSKISKSVLLVIVAILMIFSAVACNKSDVKNDEDLSATEAKATQEKIVTDEESTEEEIVPVTLKFGHYSTTDINTDEVSQYIKDKLGITLEYVQIEDEQFKVLLASGDLRVDFTMVSNDDYKKQMVEGGIVIINCMYYPGQIFIAGIAGHFTITSIFKYHSSSFISVTFFADP